MLPKKNRLPSSQIPLVVKKGKRLNCSFFVLYSNSNSKTDQPRFAFIVSLKIDKRAVVRNKIKRQLRYSINKKLGEIKAGFDIVFLVKKGMKEKSFSLINSEIHKAFQKQGLI